MFKHILFIHIFLFLSLLLAPALYSSQSFVVSGNPNAPPVVWEQYQELVGLGPDLVKSMSEELSIPMNLRRFGNWQNVQKKARNGEIDMIVSVYKNNEREEYLEFSDPYLSQPTVILVEKGKEFTFSSWDSLIGKKGVSNVGESYGQKFDEFIKEKLDVSYHQFERALQVLNLGEADYLIIDLYTALIYSRLLQGEDSITILDPPVTVQSFHFGIRKDSELVKYLPQINKIIAEKLKNSEIADTLLSHFDKWQRLTNQRSKYFDAHKQSRTSQQADYLKEQDEMARQRIIKTMVVREGLPTGAE
jgi:polar amino acid transport system substrate-binding protein